MYCKKCGKLIPDDSDFCNHCGASQKEVISTEEKPQSESEKLATVSVDKGCLGIICIWGGIVSAIIAVVVSCCLFIPLNNDKECYESGVKAHNALKELAFYGRKYECSSSCPVCHPITWRWEIKKLRWGLE